MIQPYDNHTARDNVTRECIVQGYPKSINIEWYLNNSMILRHSTSNIKLNETSRFVVIKSTLTMNGLDKDDQGDFECRASNTIASIKESTTFNVFCMFCFTLSF